MRSGTGLALIGIGAIFAFAVTTNTSQIVEDVYEE
jgi:hypothetical protein